MVRQTTKKDLMDRKEFPNFRLKVIAFGPKFFDRVSDILTKQSAKRLRKFAILELKRRGFKLKK